MEFFSVKHKGLPMKIQGLKDEWLNAGFKMQDARYRILDAGC